MTPPLAWVRAATACILALLGAFPLAARAAIWDELTDARVQEALKYGRDRADQPLERLLEPWIARSPDGRAAVVVKSDFIALAHLGWSAQREGRPVAPRELDEETFVLRALRETLHVEGVVDTSAVGLVEGVQLLEETTVRDPISFHFKLERTGSGDELRFDAYFPRGGLSPAATVRLRVLGSGGQQLVFPVDLSKVR